MQLKYRLTNSNAFLDQMRVAVQNGIEVDINV